jgi:hypothetical protein
LEWDLYVQKGRKSEAVHYFFEANANQNLCY